jgi:GNAT superfamily N-acetyltransferase
MSDSTAAAGLALRDMTVADVAAGLRLSRASGWNQTDADWQLLLSLGSGLFLVGTEGDRVVASGGAVLYGGELAWICMILVDPGRRGHGIGTVLFDSVLERVEALGRAGGVRVVGLDATPGGRGIYARRGFRDGSALTRMRAKSPMAQSPSSVRAMEPGDLDVVLAEDRRVFGADRGSVLRWAYATAPELALAVGSPGELGVGYCFGRHGDHSNQVGPVVAEDQDVARDLVRAALSRSAGRPLVVDARSEAPWLALLTELGFREQRPFTRMYLRDMLPRSEPQREWAIFGPEFA